MIERHKYLAGSEADWLALRDKLGAQGRLGGSEVGVAAGLSSYKSRYRLWAEKKGLLEPEDISDRECVRLGRDLEDYVARRFEEQSGRAVHRENCIITNAEYPHLLASIDRKIANEPSGLECKTASAWRTGDFTADKFPDAYYCQCVTYLAVTGLTRWYLAVLVMGVGMRYYCMTTDPADLDNPEPWVLAYRLVGETELDAPEKIARHFWADVGEEDPDQGLLCGSDDERDAIIAVEGLHPMDRADLPQSLAIRLEEREGLKAQIAELEARVGAIENEVRIAMGGGNEGAIDGWRITDRTQMRRVVDWKAVAAQFCPTEEQIEPYRRETSAQILRIRRIG